MKCPKCGLDNPNEYAFCSNCGAPLHPRQAGTELFTGAGNDPRANIPETAAPDAYTSPAVPNEYKPITPLGYIGYSILFSLPIIGIILMLICSFGGSENINVRNFARGMLLSVLIVIVLMTLAAVILGPAFNDIVNQYSFIGSI